MKTHRGYFQNLVLGGLLLAAGGSAWAAPKHNASATFARWTREFGEQSGKILKLLGTRNAASTPNASPACERVYDELYRDGVLDVTVALGYNDARPVPFVEDPILEKVILDALTARCGFGESVCGFRRTSKNGFESVLTKDIGPRKGPRRQIRITLFSSALGFNDDANRSQPEQLRRSREARDGFFASLSRSELVFYLGHARDGGGPDFDPPVTKKDLHPDYDWYHRNRQDFSDLLHELDSAGKNRPVLLGLLGCSTREHFARRIQRTAPEMALLLSKRSIYPAEMLQGLYTVLNGVQQMSCGDRWDADLEAVNTESRTIGKKKQTLLLIHGMP